MKTTHFTAKPRVFCSWTVVFTLVTDIPEQIVVHCPGQPNPEAARAVAEEIVRRRRPGREWAPTVVIY